MDIVSSYLKSIAQYPLLSEEEERQLLSQAKGGNISAREQFINSNLRLVVKVAKSYIGKTDLPLPDLIQEGNYGLLKAYEKYELDKGFKFSTYAVYWIKQSILLSIEKNRAVRIPKNVIDSLTTINKYCYDFKQKYTKEPSLAQIAIGTKLSEKRVKLLLCFYAPNSISLDTPFEEDGELTLGDTIPDTRIDDFLLPVENEEKRQSIKKVLDTLTEKEKTVIMHRYGFFDSVPKTLAQTGDCMGVSKERVRQIEAEALKKLRHPSRAKRLEVYR